MIKQAGEHSYEEDLIDIEFPKILDVGCRNYHPSHYINGQLRMLTCQSTSKIMGIDPDYLVPNKEAPYFQIALSDFVGLSSLVKTDDPQGTRTVRGNEVITMRLQDFSQMVGVDMWDMVKLDCEGAEYNIIMALSFAPAKQISIEFHLHTGSYGNEQVKEMEDKLLSLGYFPVKHDMTRQHGLNANFWDSLFILK